MHGLQHELEHVCVVADTYIIAVDFFYYYFFKSLFSVNPKASANKRGAPEMQGSFPGRMQQVYKGLGKNDFTKP